MKYSLCLGQQNIMQQKEKREKEYQITEGGPLSSKLVRGFIICVVS